MGPETRSTSIATPIVRENIEEAIGNTANETVCWKNYGRRSARLSVLQRINIENGWESYRKSCRGIVFELNVICQNNINPKKIPHARTISH
jgi:hypothetical protein